MTIQEFFDTFSGLWIETNKTGDTSTYDQCIDLWRAYNRKVVKAPDIFGNPPDIWNNYQSEFYDKVPRGGNTPRLGDGIIWGTNYSKYGHIAVCTDIVASSTFTSFDQNDPLGSSCHYQPHTYTGVLGWLRPKKLPQEESSEDKIVLEVIKGIIHEGSLEGLARQLVGEHEHYKSLEAKANQLDGFIAKWVEEYKLDAGSNLVEIEIEMSKLLPLEDKVNQFRNAIEKAVGNDYVNDTALLTALEAIVQDRDNLAVKLDECQLKLSNKNILWAFEWKGYTIKIYHKKGGDDK